MSGLFTANRNVGDLSKEHILISCSHSDKIPNFLTCRVVENRFVLWKKADNVN